MLHSSWGCIRSSFQFVPFFLIILIISIFYYSDDVGSRLSLSLSLPPPPPENNKDGSVREIKAKIEDTQESKRCDYFSGKWVYDNETNPLYKVEECILMPDEFACEKFGRKDLSYQHWRWQPHHCDLPRFNATSLLEKLRNKRLMYVGDSLNKNQWFSMMCMVDYNIPPPLKSVHINGSLFTFKAIEYNATIEFYWSPFLVESNADDPIKHRLPKQFARIQAIEKHAIHWTNAEFLIFDSYLWWRLPHVKFLGENFESSKGINKEVKMLKGFELALRTWSDWLKIHVNNSKTQIFWMSMSPTHRRSEEWGGKTGLNCYNETKPIMKQNYWGSNSDLNMMSLVEETIENLSKKGLNVKILNITQLSEYRKDAHPSIHKKQWRPLTKDQLSNPTTYSDCFHWCLPGVPDTWNEILYNYIV